MRHFIHIRSYAADFEWLSYCLRSLEKFATGFEPQITLEVPTDDTKAALGFGFDLKRFNLHIVNRKRFTTDDYLGQQISKMTADLIVANPGQPSDTITHFDSDIFVTEPISPADLFVDGKPLIYMTPYANLPPPPEVPWQPIVEEIIGFKVTHEFMRRHPFTYPRWFYPLLRAHIEQVHHKKFETVIARRPFKSCSEFNLLGAFAWEFYRDKFHFVDTTLNELPKEKLNQAWSYGGISDERRAWMEGILK